MKTFSIFISLIEIHDFLRCHAVCQYVDDVSLSLFQTFNTLLGALNDQSYVSLPPFSIGVFFSLCVPHRTYKAETNVT